MNKRLFIFANYDPDCLVDNVVEHYIGALAELGDIVFVTDCDTHDAELEKIKSISNVLRIISGRHGEYDFGSYKRGYQWADAQGILGDYDWVYFVNDSVYGPLRPLGPILTGLESAGNDVIGMYGLSQHPMSAILQSWFIGIKQSIACQKWFRAFLNSVKQQPDKQKIILEYEFGLSELLLKHDCKFGFLMRGIESNDAFRNPMHTLRRGMPFLKKSKLALGRIDGEKKVRKFIPADIMPMIRMNMARNKTTFEKYSRVASFKLFGIIPLLDIKKSCNDKKYRAFLFRCIPILGMDV